jgi:hypothetical protein
MGFEGLTVRAESRVHNRDRHRPYLDILAQPISCRPGQRSRILGGSREDILTGLAYPHIEISRNAGRRRASGSYLPCTQPAQTTTRQTEGRDGGCLCCKVGNQWTVLSIKAGCGWGWMLHFWMLDAGCWMLGTRCWALDAGHSMLDTRHSTLDAG